MVLIEQFCQNLAVASSTKLVHYTGPVAISLILARYAKALSLQRACLCINEV